MRKFITIISAVYTSLLLTGCLGNDLPKCDDKDTKSTLADIITKSIKADGDDYKYIDAKDIKEIGFNKDKEIRVCEANVLYSDGETENITYNIYWSSKKKEIFYVEIVN